MTTTFDFEQYQRADKASREKNYPPCKVHIAWEGGAGESPWARVVGPDLVMLDNDPIDARYRYADVVRVRGREVLELVQRTFTQRFGFQWVAAKNETVDVELP